MAEKRDDHHQDDDGDHQGAAAADGGGKREFRGSFPDDTTPPEPDWTTLCTLTPTQAESLRQRLDAAGIPCELHDLPADTAEHETQQTVASAVRVQVLEEDLEAAEEIASRGAFADEDDDPDDEEDPAEYEARLLANWFCPKCRQQKLELLPRKRSWYHLAVVLVAVIIAPWLAAGAIEATANQQWIRASHRLVDWLIVPWVVVIVVMAGMLMGAHRDRRCKACGWSTLHSKPSA